MPKETWTCPVCGYVEQVRVQGISLNTLIGNHIGYHKLSGAWPGEGEDRNDAVFTRGHG